VLTVIARALGRVQAASLKDGGGGYSTAARLRGGGALIVAEVALATTLAVAGVLLLKSFARLTSVAPGFDAGHALSFKVFPGPPRYRSIASEKQYVRDTLAQIAAVPGVDGVATVTQLPLSDPASGQAFEIEGTTPAPGNRPMAGYRTVSPNYFGLLRIPLVRGRTLTDDDRETTSPVVVINEEAARRFWPGADPIGQRIRWSSGLAAFVRTLA